MAVVSAPLPGSVVSVGLGVCVGSGLGRGEPGLLCRDKAACGSSLQEAQSLAMRDHQGLPPGAQSSPTFNLSKLPLPPAARDYSLLDMSIWKFPWNTATQLTPPYWSPSPPVLPSSITLFDWWQSHHPRSQDTIAAVPPTFTHLPAPKPQARCPTSSHAHCSGSPSCCPSLCLHEALPWPRLWSCCGEVDEAPMGLWPYCLLAG